MNSLLCMKQKMFTSCTTLYSYNGTATSLHCRDWSGLVLFELSWSWLLGLSCWLPPLALLVSLQLTVSVMSALPEEVAAAGAAATSSELSAAPLVSSLGPALSDSDLSSLL